MKKKAIGAGVVASAMALALMAGCSQGLPASHDASDDETSAEEYVAALYEPEVIEKDDGTLIQRTPSEGEVFTTLDTSYTYHTPEQTVPANTYYMQADERGCNACHEDLAETLNDMVYDHVDLTSELDIQITVQMCKDCHTFGYGYLSNQNAFGDLIHGIHAKSDNVECWNCHVGNGDGAGMELWDEVKHQQLRGITAIPDVQGDFAWDQDLVTSAADMFDFGWDYYDLDYMRTDKSRANEPLDQSMFDEWTITVSGNVDHEVTYTLPELLEKYGTTTDTVTFHCTLNPTGGPLLGNGEYTGVRLDDLLAEAGLNDNFGGITIMAPDGFTESVKAENLENAIIATELGGEPLPWCQGYPVQLVVPHSAAPAFVKEVADIVVLTKEEAAEVHEWKGWPKETEWSAPYTVGNWPLNDENGYQNKPNIALFDFDEGTIVKTGEPVTFNGYATAYDEQIVAVEFSMDGGTTWTRFDTSNSDKKNWVIWHFTYTPEADSAYVLTMRSVSDTGKVTEEPIEVLFNAKSA